MGGRRDGSEEGRNGEQIGGRTDRREKRWE